MFRALPKWIKLKDPQRQDKLCKHGTHFDHVERKGACCHWGTHHHVILCGIVNMRMLVQELVDMNM